MKEKVWVVVGIIVFLLLQGLLVGIQPTHIFMAALFAALYFSPWPVGRHLALALLPFVLFEVCYDWMRILPNYMVNPIDTRHLFETELRLFGITSADGVRLIPSQFLQQWQCAAADLMAGLFYLCWVPLPIAFGLWLFFTGRRSDYLHFALAFLFVNLIGFTFYYIHPAAPPWYVLEHGFIPDLATPGDVAGLARFDALVGVPVFHSIYVNNSNIFAAVPSLHAAYMLVATIYAVRARCRWPMIAAFAVVTVGIWATAVYSCHHYVVDVILGILTALLGVLLFEKVVMRWRPFARFVTAYEHKISG